MPFAFGIDGDGNYGYYGADDSLIPFKRSSFKELAIINSTGANHKFSIMLDSNGCVTSSPGEYLYTYHSGDSAWLKIIKECTCYVFKDGKVLYDSAQLSVGDGWSKSVQYTGTVLVAVL